LGNDHLYQKIKLYAYTKSKDFLSKNSINYLFEKLENSKISLVNNNEVLDYEKEKKEIYEKQLLAISNILKVNYYDEQNLKLISNAIDHNISTIEDYNSKKKNLLKTIYIDISEE
jgi:hypothetical protein